MTAIDEQMIVRLIANFYPVWQLELGRITQLNAESIRVFHMESLRALFVGLRSNLSRSETPVESCKARDPEDQKHAGSRKISQAEL